MWVKERPRLSSANHTTSKDNNIGNAESSQIASTKDNITNDPFTTSRSRNVMPSPPSKLKIIYLKDYENLVVK
jgi:hypothetical protein